jgi:DNA-binding CsgD family transcriptional regulator
MDALGEALESARTTSALGQAVLDALDQSVGLSAFSFVRVSGPVVSATDLFVRNARVPPARTRELLLEALPLVERELEPFARLFGPRRRRAFDVREAFPAEVVRRSELFDRIWRPLAVEQQLLGPLGGDAPIGFVCAARSRRERAFSARELARFEEVRATLERTLLGRGALEHDGLDDTLALLSHVTPAAVVLLDDAGKLLWLSEAARSRLALDAAVIGTAFAPRDREPLGRLQAWVRAARRRSALPTTLRIAVGVTTLEASLRRFEGRRRKELFLVRLADPHAASAGMPSSPATRERAARLARDHDLTPRQAEMLMYVACGVPNKAIAAALGCTSKAVEQHVATLMQKGRRPNRTALAAWFWTS